VARARTTKKLAQRIDLNYFKRPTPLKQAKLWLSIFLPLLSIIWISLHFVNRDTRVYSSGRLSAPHAILEKQCATCHVEKAGAFSAKADNPACLSCHDGPEHHASQVTSPDCASCHSEHQGRVNIAAVSDKLCATCHADLHPEGRAAQYSAHIRSLTDGHPQFAALNGSRRDSTTIKLNHAIHLKLIRRGPTGPMVRLDCGDCHRPAVAKVAWTYSDSGYVSSGSADNVHERETAAAGVAGTLTAHSSPSGRERMAPVKFANSCASCHLLSFDKRFSEGVPHDKPALIHVFLQTRFKEFVATHPAELRVARDPERTLTGKQNPPVFRTLTPAQWIAERTTEAEELLWRKTCRQCHELIFGKDGDNRFEQLNNASRTEIASQPQIAKANVTTQWMPHAKFDHEAHGAFTCVSCHEKALRSTDSTDILLPGIATCQACHAPGQDHAESRCFECHTYHDWSKRKEISPRFRYPTLQGADNGSAQRNAQPVNDAITASR
jgi:hypothetical protein